MRGTGNRFRRAASRGLQADPEKKNLEPEHLSFSFGPPTGYLVPFTNGLKVYLTGDTGIHAEMRMSSAISTRRTW